MRTYVIGRGRGADIILPDKSVAGRHAELLVTKEGRYHLTDCASGRGSWTRAGGTESTWTELRQGFVSEDHEFRFGQYDCNLQTLLEAADHRRTTQTIPGDLAKPDEDSIMLTGTVERDPLTGEIVRKRP